MFSSIAHKARSVIAIPSVAIALALAAYLFTTGIVGYRTVKLLNVAGQPYAPFYGLHDFRDNVYYPAVAYLDGRNPWDWEVYRAHYPVARPLPPYTPIFVGIHLPFGFLSYGAAEVVFFVFNSVLLIGIAVVALQGAGARVTASRALLIAALLALGRPGHQTLFIGQVSPLMVLATGLAVVHARNRPVLAVIGLVIACGKPSYALPLALLLLARGDYRVVVSGGGIAAVLGGALAIVPARAAGGVMELIQSVRNNLAIMSANDPAYRESTSLLRLDLSSLVARALDEQPTALTSILLAASVLGIASIALRRLRSIEQSGPRPLSGGVIVLALLLSLYHQAYDALLLALPVVAICLSGAGRELKPPSRIWKISVLTCLLVPAINYISTDTVINRLSPDRSLWLAITCANGIAVTIAFILWLVLAFTATSETLLASDRWRTRCSPAREQSNPLSTEDK